MRPHCTAALLVPLALFPIGRLRAQDSVMLKGPVYVARDVEPALMDIKQLKRFIRRVYPSSYRASGIEATTVLWVYVKPDRTVGACKVLRSSGYNAFDHAAEQVAQEMHFSPALLAEEPKEPEQLMEQKKAGETEKP
jgi:TonB family protein